MFPFLHPVARLFPSGLNAIDVVRQESPETDHTIRPPSTFQIPIPVLPNVPATVRPSGLKPIEPIHLIPAAMVLRSCPLATSQSLIPKLVLPVAIVLPSGLKLNETGR